MSKDKGVETFETEMKWDLGADEARRRERSWTALYNTEFGPIYRLIYRCGVPPSEVEDLTQKVFLTAYRRMDSLQDVETVPGWLRGVALRVVADHRKWLKVRRLKKWVLHDPEQQRTARTPEADAETHQAQQLVGSILQQMRPKLRDVLVLADMEELAPREIAEILNIPVNTVRSRTRLAREQFEQLLDQRPEGGADE